jgi:Domain of unknown function (DUF4232)
MPSPSRALTSVLGAAAVAVAVSLSAVGAVAMTSRTPSATTAATPTCTTGGLVVWLDTNGNGAAGSIFYKLEFTNLSGHMCTLGGYPGVSAVNLAGRMLGTPASRDTSRTPKVVTLKQDATATAVLRIVDAGNFSASSCGEVTAAGLRVVAPNATRSKAIPFPFAACSRPGPIFLTVQAVRNG